MELVYIVARKAWTAPRNVVFLPWHRKATTACEVFDRVVDTMRADRYVVNVSVRLVDLDGHPFVVGWKRKDTSSPWERVPTPAWLRMLDSIWVNALDEYERRNGVIGAVTN